MKRSIHFLILSVGGLSLGLMACGILIGLKDGAPFEQSDASDASPPDSSSGDERQLLTPDASTAMCNGGANGSLARVLQADADAVFVLVGGSTIVSSCGSKVNPCGTLAVGLKVADANRAKAIYLGPGTYNESLVMPSGVSVEGGFDVVGSTWKAQCDNVKTVLASSDAVAVRASGVLNAALRFLTIETKAHGDPAESVYGVMATDSIITLENVNVYAELAGPGPVGSPGTGLDTANANCSQTGAAGGVGGAGSTGVFGSDGVFVPGAAGAPGASGARGAAGSHIGPLCFTKCVSACTKSAVDDAGYPIDDSGTEVPEAGPGPLCAVSTLASVCGTDVPVACGGFGGIGGAGGANGAASIAVVAVGQSQVTILGGSLGAAGGGIGGNGGSGSEGADGGPAASGSSTMCFSSCGSSCSASMNTPVPGGSTSNGGAGGAGGQGGGGAGGPTFLVVTLGGATAMGAHKEQWQIPTMGAAGGAPNGPNGRFGEAPP